MIRPGLLIALPVVFYAGMRFGAQLTSDIYRDTARAILPDEFQRIHDAGFDDGYQSGVLDVCGPN